jgi:hypothetical protein
MRHSDKGVLSLQESLFLVEIEVQEVSESSFGLICVDGEVKN